MRSGNRKPMTLVRTLFTPIGAGFWLITALTLPFLWAWCKLARLWDETRRPESPTEMVQLLNRRIPPGTPVDEAQMYVERHSFRCHRATDATWTEQNPEYWTWIRAGPGGRVGTRPPQSVERVRGANIVFCYRATVSATWIIRDAWSVALVHDGDTVKAIYADRRFDGP